MQISQIAELVSAKAQLYDDHERACIAQELELKAQLKSLRPAEPNVLMGVSQAAALLSLSVDYVWKLVATGQLPSVKIGKRRLIKRSTVLAFADKHVDAPEMPAAVAEGF